MNQFEKKKIKLPEFEKYTYGVADALKNYLIRKYSIQSKKWFELKKQEQEQEQGRNFFIYSFRHSFSLRGRRLNLKVESWQHLNITTKILSFLFICIKVSSRCCV